MRVTFFRNPMAEVAYARGPTLLGATHYPCQKKMKTRSQKTRGPKKMRSEKRWGPRKRGVAESTGNQKTRGPKENAGSQRPRGPTKRFYNENGIMKATHALLVITL